MKTSYFSSVFKISTMNLKNANMGQLLYLARYTKYRYAALAELDRRMNDVRGSANKASNG